MQFDLDADRAKREAEKEPKTFTFGGEAFDLPISLPIEVAEGQGLMGEGIILRSAPGATDEDKLLAGAKSNVGYMKMGHALLGERFTRFRELGGTQDDLSAVINWAFPLYGTDAGKSRPSGDSSKSAGGSSAQTSNGSTAVTSQEISGAMEDLASGAGA